MLTQSSWFHANEIVSSSLLFIYDDSPVAHNPPGIWMIDFGKTSPLPEGQRLTHRDQWKEGNREDGYLTGIDSLLRVFSGLKLDSPQRPFSGASHPLAQSPSPRE